ncbi:hypothetical protein F1D05_14015 [Kribbella qitaiheensis]|uniref:Uncharacterized protein n=1 Tax=Kribbella qitaiheensis TaxID=1544730 RepID=A0A7G6WXV1_9ACTN|nr:hypothetical protein [Kribbella qitaiheensis]QNE18816.1 hypothetical protein F1D05_14015 [Kribbella qitaiheensis]
MPTKPNPLLGLLIGIVVAWVATTLVNYAGIKLNYQRTARFDNSMVHGLPWVLLIVVVSLLAGFVLSIRALAAGALVGAGLLLTIVGAAAFVLPLHLAFDLAKLFVVPGTDMAGYLVWDGSVLFIGGILLVLGVRRWITDARSTPRPRQDVPGYYQPGQTFPGQQYPGQYAPGQQPGQQGYPPQDGPQHR